jgi:gentisate 1,2-dioxygenase
MAQSDNGKSSEDVEFFEYTKAANPLAKGTITPVSFGELPHTLHESGPTRVIPFDLSDKLNVKGPATSPNLSANFLRIQPGESLSTRTNATSELYYVLRGAGTTERKGEKLTWATGDFFVLPGGADCKHTSSSDSALYWINDQPLLTYLGVSVSEEKFSPTIYKAEDCERELKKVAEDPLAKDRNRVSVLLANKKFGQTMTVTHTLWAMFGILPEDAVQLPHRHNSVALDLILNCKPGCYTMVSKEIDLDGNLIQPIRVDWKPYSAFVTPPYYWHAHYNESGAPAHLIPIQDAGLQTYMRTLDIEFAHAPKVQSESKSKIENRQIVVSGVG